MKCDYNLPKTENIDCIAEVPAFGMHKSFDVKEECLEEFYIALNQPFGTVEDNLKVLIDSKKVVINYM